MSVGRAREDRGYGTPLTDPERQQRHYEETGEWLPSDNLPPRGTGLQGGYMNREEEERVGSPVSSAGWYLRPDNLVTKRVSQGRISQDEGVTIPTPIFVGGITFFLGVFLGPAILSATAGGRDYLERAAKGKFAT